MAELGRCAAGRFCRHGGPIRIDQAFIARGGQFAHVDCIRAAQETIRHLAAAFRAVAEAMRPAMAAFAKAVNDLEAARARNATTTGGGSRQAANPGAGAAPHPPTRRRPR